MGKSPILVTADGRVIAESSAIAAYLISTYDTSHKFRGDEKNDWIKDESLSSFAGSTIGPITTLQITCDALVTVTPFLLRPLVRLLTGGMWNAFLGPEMKKQLKYLEGQLDGQEFFMGENPGRADFMLSWPMDLVAERRWLGDLSDYPRVKGWRERCMERPGWKEGLKKGNGYDLKNLLT